MGQDLDQTLDVSSTPPNIHLNKISNVLNVDLGLGQFDLSNQDNLVTSRSEEQAVEEKSKPAGIFSNSGPMFRYLVVKMKLNEGKENFPHGGLRASITILKKPLSSIL